MRQIDTSTELEIRRFANGIKLHRASQNTLHNHTVSDVLHLPFQVYFENTSHTTLKSNEIYAEVNGFASLQECIGEKWYKPFKYNTILPTLKNDKEVVQQNKYIIVEESGLRVDETEVHTLSIRMPWYSNENKLIGLFGLSISLGKAPLAESLLQIADLGLLNSENKIKNVIGTEFNNVYLSKQQLICAKFLLNGMTAKEIANKINLSSRTVESYIDIIKTKLKCYNKTELILKLSELFKK